MNYFAAEQRGINRNIHNRPKGRGTKSSSAFGGLNKQLAQAKVDKKWGYIDKTGKMIIEPKFDVAATFSERLACRFSGGLESLPAVFSGDLTPFSR